MRKGNSIVALLAVLLACTLFGSFVLWYYSIPLQQTSIEFRVFAWLLVISNVFLLIARALREFTGRY